MPTTDPLYPNMAFYGLPASGKSTASIFLERIGFVRINVAGYHRGGVRDVALRLWGEGADADRWKLDALASIRQHDPEVFERNFWREIARAWDNDHVVTTDDFRTDGEWFGLRSRGFVLVHVTAEQAARDERLRVTHRGITPLFKQDVLEDAERYHPDYVVTNDGTPDELYAAVTDILNLERSKRA